MDVFFKELLMTARVVTFGRTPDILARLESIPQERLLAFEALIGFVIGIQVSIQTAAPFKLIGWPLSLVALTVLWAFLFIFTAAVKREEMLGVYTIFLGGSTFLLPAVLPLLGPFLFQALFIGWPFVLARLLARKLERPPGKVFLQLVVPPAVLWVVFWIIFSLAGQVFFTALMKGPVL